MKCFLRTIIETSWKVELLAVRRMVKCSRVDRKRQIRIFNIKIIQSVFFYPEAIRFKQTNPSKTWVISGKSKNYKKTFFSYIFWKFWKNFKNLCFPKHPNRDQVTNHNIINFCLDINVQNKLFKIKFKLFSIC